MAMLILTFAALTALSDPTADRIARCETRLVSYAGWTETPDTRWSLDLAAPGGGALSYFGAEHSRDPDAPQVAALDAAFAAARPDVVFYEGPNRGVGTDARDTVTTRGESGQARWLAAQAGAEVRPLEPSPIDQVRALSATFPLERVELFFVLREAARLREREGLSGEALDAAIMRLMGQLVPMTTAAGIALPFTDVAGLEAAYRAEWSDGSDWRAAPEHWFQPGADDAETGGRFLAAVNRASSEYRNVHMYRVLAKAALEGRRVFAVVGRNHVPMQAPALACALADPASAG